MSEDLLEQILSVVEQFPAHRFILQPDVLFIRYDVGEFGASKMIDWNQLRQAVDPSEIVRKACTDLRVQMLNRQTTQRELTKARYGG